MENRIPTLYLVDSAGIFLPLQEDVFPIRTISGESSATTPLCRLRAFRRSRRHGHVRRGGAYLPVMTDQVLMTEGSGLFLAGPALVQAAIGQKYSAEELGGATMHAEISGTVDFKEPNDHLCIARLALAVSKWGHAPRAPFDRAAYDPANDAPRYAASDLHALLDSDPAKAA